MDSFFSMNIMFAWQIFIEKAFSFADGPHHYPWSSKFLFPYSTEEYVAERSFQRTCSSDTPPMGFEPTTFELEVQRATAVYHWNKFVEMTVLQHTLRLSTEIETYLTQDNDGDHQQRRKLSQWKSVTQT